MMQIAYKPIALSSLLILALAVTLSGCIKTPTDPGNYPPPDTTTIPDPNILSLSSASGSPGDTGIIVNVNLHNVIPIGAVALLMAFDSTVLTPSDTWFLKPARASTMSVYNGSFPDAGSIRFAMLPFPNPPNPLGRIEIGDGPILQLLFDVKPSAASGTTQIRFIDDPATPNPDNQLSDTSGYQVIFPQLQNSSFFVQ